MMTESTQTMHDQALASVSEQTATIDHLFNFRYMFTVQGEIPTFLYVIKSQLINLLYFF